MYMQGPGLLGHLSNSVESVGPPSARGGHFDCTQVPVDLLRVLRPSHRRRRPRPAILEYQIQLVRRCLRAVRDSAWTTSVAARAPSSFAALRSGHHERCRFATRYYDDSLHAA